MEPIQERGQELVLSLAQERKPELERVFYMVQHLERGKL
jgi:hypothetical protein